MVRTAEGKVGFRFTVGAATVPAIYDEIRDNYNGLLFVRQGTKWGVINGKGKLVQPVQLRFHPAQRQPPVSGGAAAGPFWLPQPPRAPASPTSATSAPSPTSGA